MEPASPLRGRRILLGVTGGIAAYKAALVARLLVGAGAEVDTVLTRGAKQFVGAATFEGITGRPVREEVWETIADQTHVALGRAADAVVVYPATAHTLARMAGGFADDLLTTSLLVARCPVVVAPAMHTEMWTHAATQHNLEQLLERGITVLGPDDGPLMGGDIGPGRVVDPQVVVSALEDALADQTPDGEGDLAGLTVVVTAGGTRERIDPVRYIGNRSSGRMGFAIAEEAHRRGAAVHLVAGPTHLPTPEGVVRHDITTAADLHEAVFSLVDDADIVVKAAAVADFRPAVQATSKIKKDAGPPTIELEPTVDVLAELGARRGDEVRPVLVGFAAETDDVEENGRAKLERKRVDLLAVNDVGAADAGFEVDTNRVILLDRRGGRTDIALSTKAEVARRIMDAVVSWVRS